MEMGILEAYRQASAWTNEKVAGAVNQLDAPTPCEEWDVRTVLNHMLDTQRYFIRSVRGEDAAPPSRTPPPVLSDDPVADFERSRSEAIAAFSAPGVEEKARMSVGIAFSDQLLHGWDLARATGQDATMPDGLAQTAYETIHGHLTGEQRKGVFGPEIDAPPDASMQDKLLAYTGRTPG